MIHYSIDNPFTEIIYFKVKNFLAKWNQTTLLKIYLVCLLWLSTIKSEIWNLQARVQKTLAEHLHTCFHLHRHFSFNMWKFTITRLWSKFSKCPAIFLCMAVYITVELLEESTSRIDKQDWPKKHLFFIKLRLLPCSWKIPLPRESVPLRWLSHYGRIYSDKDSTVTFCR